MTAASDNPKRQDSLIRTLGLSLLICCLGTAVVLLIFISSNRIDKQPRTDLRHIPPEWIGYRQTVTFVCPIKGKATCFAVFDDSTFVIGSADPPMLSFFNETGTLLRTIDLPEEPRAIVCGTPDTIFTDKIVVAYSRQIAVYSAEGHCEDLWKIPGRDVRSIVLTPEHLFAACSHNCFVDRFDTTGDLNGGFGNANHMIGFYGFVVFAAPITMTFSPQSGLLYTANPGRHRVEVFTQDGIYQPELSWGEPSGKLDGFTACCNPIGLAVLGDGRILTVEKGISRIKIYRTDGTLDTVVAGPDVLDNLPPEIGRTPLEPGGRYFSAIPLAEGRIAVFDFSGAVLRIFAPL